jgi:hypothetical protein
MRNVDLGYEFSAAFPVEYELAADPSRVCRSAVAGFTRESAARRGQWLNATSLFFPGTYSIPDNDIPR